jgi:ribonucleoside-diphosphate reductase alpha chain
LRSARDNGYRNSQISVLAPTGCLVADSLVLTDRGLMRLNRLGDVNGKQWQDVNFRVLTDEGPKDATKFYVNGIELTQRIVTKSGYAIQGTLKHRIKVVEAATGEMVWKRFSDIAPGDVVALSMGTLVGEPRTVNLPPLGEEYWTGDYTTRAPQAMSPELAELIGYFMGDGSLHAKGPRFCVANTDEDVAQRVKSLLKSLFNLDAHITPQGGYQEVAAHSGSAGDVVGSLRIREIRAK